MLKNNSDNKDDNVKTGSYDDVVGLYTKVNRTTGNNETRNDKTYQERLENDAGNKNSDNAGTGSYDDVLTSYTELNRNIEDETTDGKTYQKLLKNNSDTKDTDDIETGLYDDVSTPYAELNKNPGNETTDNNTYQKLIENDSDCVLPANANIQSSCEEIGLKNLGYTEVDNTKQDDDASYQNLTKN